MSLSVSQNEPAGFSRTKSGWPTVELGDVCHVQLGKMLSPKSKTGVRPVPYLRNENVQWNRFDLTDVSWMDFSEVEEAKFRLQPGDLLVCEGGEPGRAAVWAGQVERCCYQKALHRIRPRDERLFPPFLMYRLWMSAMNGEFAGSQTQTTISHVPREKLVRLTMPLPPLTEQQRIAAGLTQALARVGAVRRIAEDRLAAAEALPAAYLREVFEAQLWPVAELRGLCRTITDGTHLPPPFTVTGIPFLFVRNIVAGIIDFDVEKYISEETYRDLTKKHKAERGDVLFSAVGSFGVAVVVRTDARFAFQRHIAHIKPDATRLESHFLAFFLNSPPGRSQSEAVAMGGAQRTVTLADLREFRIPVPPLDEQRRVATDLSLRVEAVEFLIARCREELAAIEALPAAVLRAGFNGDS